VRFLYDIAAVSVIPVILIFRGKLGRVVTGRTFGYLRRDVYFDYNEKASIEKKRASSGKINVQGYY